MIQKVCFLIPVYPRDYNFLSFLNILPDINFDIILILSYHSDYELLESLNFKKIYKVLILEDFLKQEYITKLIDDRIIITFKKYFCLNKYKDTYKYLATIDSEVRFINIDNIYEQFDNFFSNKKVYGGLAKFHKELIYKINYNSASIFSLLEQNKIEKGTYNFLLYFWFSDIPVYESNTLNEFLKYISYTDNELFTSKLNWYIFDYIPYVSYVNLYHNFELVNINQYNITRAWSLESMPFTTYTKIKDTLDYTPMWLIENTYNENKEVLNDIILVYHLNDGRYHHIND